MNGVILVNKEINRTSRDVVNDLVHIFHTKKVGHTGTLDPLATGVLVTTLGRYTKLNELLTSTYKEYICTFNLGILTDTLDITGTILKEEEVNVTREEIIKVINSYIGIYNQEVPLYSSVKVNGKKLYEYARSGESVVLPSREVNIKNIEILSIENAKITIKTLVSKGTYIRSLVRDIGDSLNTYATMESLVRTKQGDFTLEECFTIDDIQKNKYKLLKIKDILDVEIVNPDEKLLKEVSNGVKLKNIFSKELVLFMNQEKEVCLYKRNEDTYAMYLYIGEGNEL